MLDFRDNRYFSALSFESYRIFFRIEREAVRVYLVADEGRSMQDLLKRCLLEKR